MKEGRCHKCSIQCLVHAGQVIQNASVKYPVTTLNITTRMRNERIVDTVLVRTLARKGKLRKQVSSTDAQTIRSGEGSVVKLPAVIEVASQPGAGKSSMREVLLMTNSLAIDLLELREVALESVGRFIAACIDEEDVVTGGKRGQRRRHPRIEAIQVARCEVWSLLLRNHEYLGTRHERGVFSLLK